MSEYVIESNFGRSTSIRPFTRTALGKRVRWDRCCWPQVSGGEVSWRNEGGGGLIIASRGKGEATLSTQCEHHDSSYVIYPDPRWNVQYSVQSHRGERRVKHLTSPSMQRRFFASVTFSRTSIKSTAAHPGSPGRPGCYALVCHQQTSPTKRSTRKS